MVGILLGLITYSNKNLLRFIITGDHVFKDQIQYYINNALLNLQTFETLSLLLSNVMHLELITSYITISKENVIKLIDRTEEDFCVSAWEFLNNYLVIKYP